MIRWLHTASMWNYNLGLRHLHTECLFPWRWEHLNEIMYMLRSDPTTPNERNCIITRSIDHLYRLMLPSYNSYAFIGSSAHRYVSFVPSIRVLLVMIDRYSVTRLKLKQMRAYLLVFNLSNIIWCFCCFNEASNTTFLPTSLYSAVIKEGAFRDWDNVLL